MSYSAFSERATPPTEDAMLAVAGVARPLWERLAAFATGECGARAQLKFYGCSYGWALVFSARGRALLALYPREDILTACVVIGEEPLQRVLAEGAGVAVREAAARATPYREGRWLFVPVRDVADAANVERLVAAKRAAR